MQTDVLLKTNKHGIMCFHTLDCSCIENFVFIFISRNVFTLGIEHAKGSKPVEKYASNIFGNGEISARVIMDYKRTTPCIGVSVLLSFCLATFCTI